MTGQPSDGSISSEIQKVRYSSKNCLGKRKPTALFLSFSFSSPGWSFCCCKAKSSSYADDAQHWWQSTTAMLWVCLHSQELKSFFSLLIESKLWQKMAEPQSPLGILHSPQQMIKFINNWFHEFVKGKCVCTYFPSSFF